MQEGAAVSSIVLRTEIPGPRSRELTARKERVVARAKSLWTRSGSITPRAPC